MCHPSSSSQNLLGLRRSSCYFALSLTRDTATTPGDLLPKSMSRAITYRDKFRDNTNTRPPALHAIMKNTFINDHRRAADQHVDERVEMSDRCAGCADAGNSPRTGAHGRDQDGLDRLDATFREPFLMCTTKILSTTRSPNTWAFPIGTVKEPYLRSGSA